jgi:hypothetical protein
MLICYRFYLNRYYLQANKSELSVKFQFDETVKHGDAEVILRLLEYCFRDVSLKTIRTERQLVVYGLGPSSRIMNRNDQMVLQAISQHTTTIIHAEVSFLASAFLGNISQDRVVRSKIDQVFQRMQTQLSLDAVPDAVVPQTFQANQARPTKLTARTTAIFIEPASPASPTAEQLPLQSINRGHRPPGQSLTEQPELIAGESIATVPTRPLVPESPASFSSGATVAPAPTPSIPTTKISRSKQKRSVAPLIIFMALLFVLGAAYLLRYRYPATSPFPLKSRKQPVASMTDQPRVTHTNRVPASPINAQAPPATSSRAFSTNPPTDLKEWVGAWTAAMRTRNPQVQVSFYADPVTRYFLRSNVSRNQLLKDKQSDIEKREGLWTIKAENIIVMQKTPSTAIIRLTKHIIAELPSSLIREQRINTQLKLKSVNGSWKITAEQTLQ